MEMLILPKQNKIIPTKYFRQFCLAQSYQPVSSNNNMGPDDEQPSILPLGFHFNDQRSFINISTAHLRLIYFGAGILAEIYLDTWKMMQHR